MGRGMRVSMGEHWEWRKWKWMKTSEWNGRWGKSGMEWAERENKKWSFYGSFFFFSPLLIYADFQVSKLFCVASFVVILGHGMTRMRRRRREKNTQRKKKQIVFQCIIYDPKSKNLINIQQRERVRAREQCECVAARKWAILGMYMRNRTIQPK